MTRLLPVITTGLPLLLKKTVVEESLYQEENRVKQVQTNLFHDKTLSQNKFTNLEQAICFCLNYKPDTAGT